MEKGMLCPALRTHEQPRAATAAEAPIDVAAVQWRVRIMNTKEADAETGVAVPCLDHPSTRLPYSPTQPTRMFRRRRNADTARLCDGVLGSELTVRKARSYRP